MKVEEAKLSNPRLPRIFCQSEETLTSTGEAEPKTRLPAQFLPVQTRLQAGFCREFAHPLSVDWWGSGDISELTADSADRSLCESSGKTKVKKTIKTKKKAFVLV